MNQTSDRVPCPKCQANNFPSSAVCWQCGEPLQARQDESQPPTTPGPSQPAPGVEQPRSAYPPPAPSQDTKIFIILGFVFAALGVLCCPILGIAGIVLGAIAYSRGNQTGVWVIVANVVGLAIALAIGVMWQQMFKQGRMPWTGPWPGPR